MEGEKERILIIRKGSETRGGIILFLRSKAEEGKDTERNYR